jgi:hypothetical protein
MGMLDPYVEDRHVEKKKTPPGWLVLTFSNPADAARVEQEVAVEEQKTGRIKHVMATCDI